MRTPGRSARRAVLLSAGLHVVLFGLVLYWRGQTPPDVPPPPRIDTRLELEIAVEPVVPEATVTPIEIAPTRPIPTSPSPPSSTQSGRLPRIVPIPGGLTPELQVRIRALVAGPVGGAVVEVANEASPPTMAASSADGKGMEVRPAAAVEIAKPIHGGLKDGQTIVYVLDISGSMGEWGKFDRARAALMATLTCQSQQVRFQIVVYAGTARLLLPVSGLQPTTPDRIARVKDALTRLETAGRSNHIAGVRAAVDLFPDLVVLITDADDLPTAQLRAVATQAKGVRVFVARVSADGVGTPLPLK